MGHSELINISHKKIIEMQRKDNGIEILKTIDKLIDIVKQPEKFIKSFYYEGTNESIISVLSSVCLFLGEVRDIVSDEIDMDELSYQYMVIVRRELEKNSVILTNALFGGLSDIGFGVYALHKSTSHYEKFLNSLTELIVNLTLEEIKKLKKSNSDLWMQSYDTMTGLAGITAYLLLHNDVPKINNLIKEILQYFVSITQEKEIYGHDVPGYYISSRNQFLTEEKEEYKMGNFNLGLSHGITGPLAILGLALKEGIKVDEQEQAIKRILEVLKTFKSINEKGEVFWPGRIRFEDYIKRNCKIGRSRASWCYGVPGIARTMYIVSSVIGDVEGVNLSLRAIDGLCNMNQDEWMLDSPSICHGYAGLLVVMEAMYIDRVEPEYKKCRNRLVDILLGFYEEDSLYGFVNIDYEKVSKDQYSLKEENKISIVNGAIGVVLTLLATIQPTESILIKHLLIN